MGSPSAPVKKFLLLTATIGGSTIEFLDVKLAFAIGVTPVFLVFRRSLPTP